MRNVVLFSGSVNLLNLSAPVLTAFLQTDILHHTVTSDPSTLNVSNASDVT